MGAKRNITKKITSKTVQHDTLTREQYLAAREEVKPVVSTTVHRLVATKMV